MQQINEMMKPQIRDLNRLSVTVTSVTIISLNPSYPYLHGWLIDNHQAQEHIHLDLYMCC